MTQASTGQITLTGKIDSALKGNERVLVLMNAQVQDDPHQS